jgi:hypothetical protein
MRTPILLAALGALVSAPPASAQKTEDEARLVFTMGLTYTGSSDLWNVEDQPILVPAPGPGFDLINLDRNISSSLGVLFSGMYFQAGVRVGRRTLLHGSRARGRCSLVPQPRERTQQLCASIDGATKSVRPSLSVGPVLRAGANQPISPYIRAQVGLLFSNLSPISMSGTVVVTDSSSGAQEALQYAVYTDPSSTRITPGFVFGGGLTAVIGKGWQLRTEVRDNLVQIATVAGPTSPGNDDPEIVNEWKNLWSIVLAADIVLEKKRGRRY